MAQPPTKRKVMGRIDLAQTSPPPRAGPSVGGAVRANISHTLSPTASSSSSFGAASTPGSVGRSKTPRARVDMASLVGMSSPVGTPPPAQPQQLHPPPQAQQQGRPGFATPESAPALRRFGSSTSSVASSSSLGPSAFARVTSPQQQVATAGPSTPRNHLNGTAAAAPSFVRSPVVQEEEAPQFSPSNVTVRKDRRRLVNRSIDASAAGSPTFASAFAAESAAAAAASSSGQPVRRTPAAVRGHVRAATTLASPASFNSTPTPAQPQPLRANAFRPRSPAHRSRTPSPGPDVALQPGPLRRSGPLATPYDSPVASAARSRENSYSADAAPVRPARPSRDPSEGGASSVSSASAGASSSTSASGPSRAVPAHLSLPQAGAGAQPRSPGAPFASLIETGLLSPTSESAKMLSPAEAYEAAEARVHRRLLDLEITNKSLLVINDGLEKTKLRQSKEISDLRRRLRDGRFAVGGGGGLGSAMGLSGTNEELEDESDDFEDADEGVEEDPELEASHQRCNTLINNLLAQARASIVARYDEETRKGGNRVLHPLEMRELEEQRLKEEQHEAADETANQTDTADSTRLGGSAETSMMESSSGSIGDLSHAAAGAAAAPGDASLLSNDDEDGDSTSLSLSSSLASLESADTASDATETQDELPLPPGNEAGDVSID